MLNVIAGMLGSGAAAITNSYESIATVTVGAGGSSSISFSSIVGTYKHLQLRYTAQTNRGTFGIDEAKITFNGDTGSNYTYHIVMGTGSVAQTEAATSITSSQVGSGNLGTSTASTWGSVILDLLDYASTNKTKVYRALGGADVNGTVGGVGGRVSLASGLWNSTSAITSLTLAPVNSSTFSQHSKFALYGIRG